MWLWSGLQSPWYRANNIGAGRSIQRGADAGRVVEVTATIDSVAGRNATRITDVTKV